MNNFLIGKIINTHGVKGEIKIYPYTDELISLSKQKIIFLDDSLTKKYEIESTKLIKDLLVVKLSGINSIEQAKNIIDKYVYIPKDPNEKLEENTYYIQDLLDANVVDENNVTIGKLTYIFNTGANDIYEITDSNGKIIYVPAIKDVVMKIDIVNKEIIIKLMEGLI